MSTASQTIGPYWHQIRDEEWANLTRFGAAGQHITIEGIVTDGDGALVTDAAIELWQASPTPDEVFPGYGRAATDAQGRFRFTTIKPQPLAGPRGTRDNTWQAPHCGVSILARGLLKALFTRIYFADEPLNETDPILNLIDPGRRATLIAQPAGAGAYRLDICLQGEAETVFMEF